MTLLETFFNHFTIAPCGWPNTGSTRVVFADFWR
jgi:hypothetical protein